MQKRLFVFGLGYSCLHFLRAHAAAFTEISGTVRTDMGSAAFANAPLAFFRFDGTHADAGIAERVATADLILVSVPPGMDGDPVLAHFSDEIANSAARVIYLSSVGVYADHGGAWIDETATVVRDDTRRGLRARAEAAWQTTCGDRLRILRLAGIYGPGRNAFVNLASGRAHRIVKPGQVFNRIHVDDIARTIAAAADCPAAGIWNVCDDEPAPPQDVVTYAAGLMNVPPPPAQDFTTADLSAMARSFYASNNRISNARLKNDLGVSLQYPDYRSGLDALWNARGDRSFI
ncbi:MAG: NAD(P)-dependent oxidoreductase [Tardiphaga sp.]